MSNGFYIFVHYKLSDFIIYYEYLKRLSAFCKNMTMCIDALTGKKSFVSFYRAEIINAKLYT